MKSVLKQELEVSDMNKDAKETLTKVVVSTLVKARGRKSGGVKIATLTRDLPIITVAPFTR